MKKIHLVRIDSCGTVGRYRASSQQLIERGMRVVCRTQRGMEAGEVLVCVPEEDEDEELNGDLLRPLNQQDQAQLDHLAQQRGKAIEACQDLLDQAATPAVVVDAVYPLDGQWISFYILGAPAPSMSNVAREIGTQFNVNVQFLSVTDDETGSCGSGGCGESGGCSTGACSTGGCATCPAADACRK